MVTNVVARVDDGIIESEPTDYQRCNVCAERICACMSNAERKEWWMIWQMEIANFSAGTRYGSPEKSENGTNAWHQEVGHGSDSARSQRKPARDFHVDGKNHRCMAGMAFGGLDTTKFVGAWFCRYYMEVSSTSDSTLMSTLIEHVGLCTLNRAH